MIAVCNVNIRSKHIVVANLHIPACIDHYISVEIVAVPDLDSDSVESFIQGPKPAALRKGIEVANLDLSESPTAAATLHSIPSTGFHTEHPIQHKPPPAGQTH